MAGIVVRYRTSLSEADRNQRLIEAVFAELACTDPGGIRYAAMRLADGASFVHVALIDDPAANPLLELPAFAAFQHGLAERCEVKPEAAMAALIGSYKMF